MDFQRPSAPWFLLKHSISCHLSIICPRAGIQSPCTVRNTIRLIAAMSDRRSAAADITQTQQSGHQCRENENAPLVLKRKRRLRAEGRGPFLFLHEAHSLFAVYQNTGCTVWFLFPCNYLVPIQTSCGLCGWDPVSYGATWPWKECMCHVAEEPASLTSSCSLHPQKHTEDTRPAKARRRKYLRKSIIYID